MALRLDQAEVDFATIEDGISLQGSSFGFADQRADQYRGRMDSLVLGTVMLNATSCLKVIMSRNVTHTAAFLVASQLASVANLAPGRVGWRPQVSSNAADSAIIGGKPTPSLMPEDIYVPTRIAHRLRSLFDDAADFVAVVKALWQTFPGSALSTETTSAPRDFLDPSRISRDPITAGQHKASGPLNVPVFQPPETMALAHHALEPYRFAAIAADSVLVTPDGDTSLAKILSVLQDIEELSPMASTSRIYCDLIVILGDSQEHARSRKEELDGCLGSEWSSDTHIFVGTPPELIDLIQEWTQHERFSGVRLRPAVIPEDVNRIIEEVMPRIRG
ncbi:LLM class flavin-dependent oxidoreductase [Brevibacterium sp. XM4083]|uniref:LLM class flavin-dependent oxidoreductase n=1 Tax=Brevibacterium sp. XM4083 TaxID=2583238 RepID=UPI0015E80BDA|nr:LLM class flavin-dependent oxidoreductase [Brevibacterium sp. XM4083]